MESNTKVMGVLKPINLASEYDEETTLAEDLGILPEREKELMQHASNVLIGANRPLWYADILEKACIICTNPNEVAYVSGQMFQNFVTIEEKFKK